MVDPVRVSADFVARIVELGTAGLNELTRLGSNSLLAALLARLGLLSASDAELAPGDDVSPEEMISRGLLAGDGESAEDDLDP